MYPYGVLILSCKCRINCSCFWSTWEGVNITECLFCFCFFYLTTTVSAFCKLWLLFSGSFVYQAYRLFCNVRYPPCLTEIRTKLKIWFESVRFYCPVHFTCSLFYSHARRKGWQPGSIYSSFRFVWNEECLLCGLETLLRSYSSLTRGKKDTLMSMICWDNKSQL